MKHSKNIPFILIFVLIFTVGCNSKNTDESDKNSINFGIYHQYVHGGNGLIWKLTKESFFAQKDNAEKENKYVFTADIIYTYGAGVTFANEKENITLIFPKPNYKFDENDFDTPYYNIDLLGNYAKIFEKYDYLLACTDEDGLRKKSEELIVSFTYSETPYAFVNDKSLAKDCYDAFCLFFNTDIVECYDECLYYLGFEMSSNEHGYYEELERYQNKSITLDNFLNRVEVANNTYKIN